jgi:ribosomal protein L4
MSNVKCDFVAPGLTASQQELDEIGQLVDHLLKLPAFTGKHPATVLNALVSAYWTAADTAGMQAQAAQGMVQIGGSYLARLALAQRARAGDAPDKPVVH